jgi:hypothetical protein
VAQFDDSRAKAFLGEGRNTEAESIARACVRSLEQGGEQSLLAGSLITLGTALAPARLERNGEALTSLRRGAEIAEQAGDPDTAASHR